MDDIFDSSTLLATPAPTEVLSQKKNVPPKSFVEDPFATQDDVFGSSSLFVETGVKATLSNGERITLKPRKSKSSSDDDISRPGARNHYGIPIHSLLTKIKLDRDNSPQPSSRGSTPVPELRNETRLLSEKWRPRKWIDLAGSERSHRFMMKWLVSWSSVVFGHDHSSGLDPTRLDSLGRPKRKVLLIHGAPGIGKTTVAHILARQAGYNVLEVNASDERTADSVDDDGSAKKINLMRNKIATAIFSHRVEDTSRPVCIIADEIDGADQGLIRVLVDIIKSDERVLYRFQNEDGTKKSVASKRRKGDSSKLLQRPIIAICNDVYAHSLKDLRPYAEMVHYAKVPTRTMVTKLRDICKTEKLSIETSALTEIAESMDGDLRSCLNMLQFGLSRHQDGKLMKKDTSMALKTLANRVFLRRTGSSSKSDEAAEILEEIHSYADYDKLLQACFSLYPKMQYHDDMVRKPSALGEYTAFYEMVNNAIYRQQHFQLNSYLGHAVLAFFSLFSSGTNVIEAKVKSDYEIYETSRRNANLVKEMLATVGAHTRSMFDSTSFVTEFAPYLLHIMSPPIESVSSVNSKEKNRLRNSAHAMMSVNCTFTKDRLDGGALVFRIEPPFEQIAIIDEEGRQKATVGKFTTRQYIRDLIEREKQAQLAEQGESTTTKHSAPAIEGDEPAAKKRRVEKKKMKLDFFGREVLQTNSSREGTPLAAQPAEEEKEEMIWVSYLEGFSNAVRKDMCWSELWS
ncbi:chromosome transmission fidelity protein 18 [Trichomonascus vanleenenianus]|uniref:Ctf18p n=1 Tax=Trichomonascus vanleenenianus TaxID=2268995 RepID=UPI003ECAA990